MQAMLEERGQAVAPGAPADVPMARAGGHTARALDLPANRTPVCLPAYAPAPSAIERGWLHLASASSRGVSGRAATTSRPLRRRLRRPAR
jgi:hypothetical protein